MGQEVKKRVYVWLLSTSSPGISNPLPYQNGGRQSHCSLFSSFSRPIQRSYTVSALHNNNTIISIIIHIHCITSSGVWMNDKETIENPLRAGQFFYSCAVLRVPCAISSVYGTIKGGRTHTQPTRRPVCENRPRRYRYLNPFPPLFLAFGCAGRKEWIVLPPRPREHDTHRTLSHEQFPLSTGQDRTETLYCLSVTVGKKGLVT
mmetsp:Transcript_19235/g.19536  ORF Transcript_19235/g.19536 Transcript_19235/m.19536 type:complete len:204 (-) Transcript_19235:547-1158(-)